MKETITVYEKNGKVRETITRKGNQAVEDLAKMLYNKLVGYKTRAEYKGYGKVVIITYDDFGRVKYEFEGCDNI